MKKLIAVTAVAAILSVPSVVFAEASWYGSLRVGVESSDSQTSVKDGDSHWGIRGSAEASEGLTAVYRFETMIDAATAGNPGGRLSYVGLSGGFGSVTVGQVWSASYNATGAITDNANFYGDSHTTYRQGHVVSYAFSNDAFSLQLDASYSDGDPVDADGNGNDNPADDLEQLEFGLTVNTGEMGRIALSYVDDKFQSFENDKFIDDTGLNIDEHTQWRTKSTIFAGEFSVGDLKIYVGSGKTNYSNISPTSKNIASSAVRADQKVTFFGTRGSIGDKGLDYVFQWRDVKDSHEPWVLALNKSLGGGATVSFEHGNFDGELKDDGTVKANATRLSLQVDF